MSSANNDQDRKKADGPAGGEHKHACRTTARSRSEHMEVFQGHETVLLVEDDIPVRSFAKMTLETFGYRTIEAADGKEAVERFMEHKDEIQIIVSDVIMPGMSGTALQKEVRQVAPDIPMLFMSGYPEDVVYNRGLLDRDAAIIFKPFPHTVLLKKLREMLKK